MNCKTANEISISDFLQSKGFKKLESHRSNKEAFFENPIRSENVSSFSVNLEKNLWYDFGINKGGKFIDLIARMQKTDIKGALSWLDENLNNTSVSKPQIREFIVEKGPRFSFKKEKEIFSYALKDYLTERKISLEIAKPHLKEVRFYDNDKEKEYFSLGMKNDSGGYSLRCILGKVILAPNDMKYIPTNSITDTVLVFEGIFDFLSYLMIKKSSVLNEDIIILNTLAFAKRASTIISQKKHIKRIISFLDYPSESEQSQEIMKYSLDILSESGELFVANSFFKGYEDVADFWRKNESIPKIEYRKYPEETAFVFSKHHARKIN